MSYGIWLQPIGDAALTDDPGFLTACGRDLSFETFEHAEFELNDMPAIADVVMTARRKPDPFLDFEADDSGAQAHEVEPDYAAIFAGIERAIGTGAVA